jgi:osmoprotectant transport system ATP-binding protein
MLGNVAIAFEGVSKRFSTGSPVLNAITLSVREREFVAVVGASGAGKTTFLQLINRLSEPSSGLVRIGGVEAQSLDPIALRRRIGYVFQEVGLFPHMTVGENIAITPLLLGWAAARRDRRVDELLDLVRLDRSYRDRFAHELSGGERQRVGVARALAAHPDIVLMDEPFGALDPVTRDAIGQDYRRLHDELGLTTVIITHDMLEALGLASRIVVLGGGSVIADGSPSDLMAHGHPEVRGFMDAPRKLAERVGTLLSSKEAPGG